jgi:hypothetical protein
MGRGKAAKVGDTRVANNGYHYTKTENGWTLTHWLTAEKVLGRPIDPLKEQVRFKEPRFKNSPYDENGFTVIPKRGRTNRNRLAHLKAKRDEINAEILHLEHQLRIEES